MDWVRIRDTEEEGVVINVYAKHEHVNVLYKLIQEGKAVMLTLPASNNLVGKVIVGFGNPTCIRFIPISDLEVINRKDTS